MVKTLTQLASAHLNVMELNEIQFLLSLLKPDQCVLEYGSGYSTLEIQKRVKHLVSIEHNLEWFNKISWDIQENVEYHYVPPNNQDWQKQFNKNGSLNYKSEDGSFEDFVNFVLLPTTLNKKFDLIFIDGAARVACAAFSRFMIKPNGIIVMHDYGPNGSSSLFRKLPYRIYYDVVEEWLEMVESVGCMCVFKVKKSIENKESLLCY